MSFTLKAVLSALLLLTLNLATANHLRIGDVTQYGEFDSIQGRREYHATAHIIRPVFCWEDLEAEGVTVEVCTAKRITFSGNIDESDFAEGTVITFPKEDYLAMGCPTPPQTDALSRVDQIVFREIRKSKVKKGDVIVKTRYISGGRVVPDVELHIGDLLPTARQLSSTNGSDVSLDALSRTNNIGVNNFNRRGSKTIFSGARVDWRFSITAGICEFKFSRLKLRATWEQRLSADATATLDFQGRLKKTASGEIFKTAIPGAGFSIKVFLVGRIRAGLFAGIDYEAAIETGAAATATFNGGINAGQKVTVGIRKFSVKSLPSNGRTGSATLNFKSPSGSASAFVDGFLGLRPFVEAGLDLPLVGDANVDIGATVGLNAKVRFNTVPFRPVSGGRKIGVCENCHSVQGTLDLEGRRLSVSAKVPGFSRKEKVIRSKFLDYRIGTLCLFSRVCPAFIVPTIARSCKCTCTSISAATAQCKSPRCSVKRCRNGRLKGSTGFSCCPVRS